MPDRPAGLRAAAEHAEAFLATLDERPVAARADASAVRSALGGPLPERGDDPAAVIEALAAGAEPGLVATAGPRHFGFVIGGQAANATCLAAARHAVFRDTGWDVERDGLIAAPRVRILCGEQAHATIYTSLRLLGLGGGTAVRIPADAQGRMIPGELAKALTGNDGPTIVCAQAGNVATGAFDAFGPIADVCAEHDAWLHVDGAFGLWAASAPATRHLTAGVERANSWAVDAHKWLNV